MKALWLDELPSQAVLDGIEPFPASERSKLELSPVSFGPEQILPTFSTSDLEAYETSVLAELGFL